MLVALTIHMEEYQSLVGSDRLRTWASVPLQAGSFDQRWNKSLESIPDLSLTCAWLVWRASKKACIKRNSSPHHKNPSLCWNFLFSSYVVFCFTSVGLIGHSLQNACYSAAFLQRIPAVPDSAPSLSKQLCLCMQTSASICLTRVAFKMVLEGGAVEEWQIYRRRKSPRIYE